MYCTALNADRQELHRGLASIAFGQADALFFPTTPSGAPQIENQWKFQVGGKDVTDIFLYSEHASVELRRRARNQPSEGTETRRGSHSASSSMRPPVTTVICSSQLAQWNKSSGPCPDPLASKLRQEDCAHGRK